MRALIFSCLVFWFVPPSAFAQSWRLTLDTPDWGLRAEILSCIAHRTCSPVQAVFGGGDRYHILITADRSEVTSLLRGCPLSRARGSVGFYLEDAGVLVSQPLPDGEHYDPSDLVPAVLPKIDEASRRVALREAEKLVKRGEYIKALLIGQKAFGVGNPSFQVVHDPSLDQTRAAAVTDGGTRLIRFRTPTSACDLFRTIRHELDHTLQYASMDRCGGKAWRHLFADHVSRERAAYMNDILNISRICPGQQKEIEWFSVNQILGSYLRR